MARSAWALISVGISIIVIIAICKYLGITFYDVKMFFEPLLQEMGNIIKAAKGFFA